MGATWGPHGGQRNLGVTLPQAGPGLNGNMGPFAGAVATGRALGPPGPHCHRPRPGKRLRSGERTGGPFLKLKFRQHVFLIDGFETQCVRHASKTWPK
eukprot:1997790-Lingulodinium_polyedra.AAC.1